MPEPREDGATNTGMLWGGRFADGPAPALEALSRSTHFDWRLTPYDIAGSHAHAKALGAAGLLTAEDEAALHAGLDALTRRYDAGDLHPGPGDEDVHGALERLLLARALAQGHQDRHARLGPFDTETAGVGQLEIGDLVIHGCQALPAPHREKQGNPGDSIGLTRAGTHPRIVDRAAGMTKRGDARGGEGSSTKVPTAPTVPGVPPAGTPAPCRMAWHS